jgi:hypothetical protein
MHSRRAPAGPVTFGRGDVTGDGNRDLVVVDARGRVVVWLRGGGQAVVRLVTDSSLRLQGLADLFGNGRRDIVVASSAAGCCGYRLTDALSVVLDYWRGQLRLLRYPSARPFLLSFNAGRGDVFAGVRCAGHRLTQVTVDQVSPGRLKVTTSVFRLTRNVVTGQAQATGTDTGGGHRALAITKTACPSLDPYGWAR